MKPSLSRDGAKIDSGVFENRAKRMFRTEWKRVTVGAGESYVMRAAQM
jgi:hypothetical protein